jgi:hypothetical protein
MDTALRIIPRIVFTSILAGILGPHVSLASQPAEAADASDPVDGAEPVGAEPLTFDNATEAQIELVTGAIATFEAAGLELPPLFVDFDLDSDGCSGHPGFFTPGMPATIQLCTEMRHVVLHELAHAWDWHVLDEATRDDFVEEHGLPTWNSRDHEWAARGVELMADTVAIGLTLVGGSDTPNVIAKLCSFEDITGTEHPALTDADCGLSA